MILNRLAIHNVLEEVEKRKKKKICKNCVYFHPRANEKGWGGCDITDECINSTKEIDTCPLCIVHR